MDKLSGKMEVTWEWRREDGKPIAPEWSDGLKGAAIAEIADGLDRDMSGTMRIDDLDEFIDDENSPKINFVGSWTATVLADDL